MNITVNQSFFAIIPVPESKSTDTITYEIRKGSDGSIFAFGVPTFVGGISWKVTFTPAVVGEVYIVEVTNSTLDVKYQQEFRAVSAISTSSMPSAVPTVQEMLDLIQKAIYAKINNEAIQSYSINGRNIQYMSLSELQSLEMYYTKKLACSSGITRTYAEFENA
jgi:hypothetical protein